MEEHDGSFTAVFDVHFYLFGSLHFFSSESWQRIC